MTRAALTKLLILVILAFIVCLPEFFTLYRASKVNFLCLPYRPCERGNQVKMGGNGKIGEAEITRKGMCDPSQTAEREKWEHVCTQKIQSEMTDPGSDSRNDSEDPEKSWFICETDMNMTELHRNISSSGYSYRFIRLPKTVVCVLSQLTKALKVHFEVSVELQLRDAETLNLTLYSLSNHSFSHLHPLVEEEEEEEGNMKDDEGQRKAFYCCLPALSTSESANQNRCLLWLANQTVLTAMSKESPPRKTILKDEWRCVFRVLWLVLLCLVLLTVVTTVLGQIWGRCLCKKPKVHRVGYDFTGQQLNDGEKRTEMVIPKGMTLQSNGSRSWSELSPIQEVDSQDDIETLLDGNVEQCYTANLHHRSHPSTSHLPEEQAW